MAKTTMNKKKAAEYLAGLSIRLMDAYNEKYARLAVELGLTDSEFKCLRLIGTDKGLSNKKIADRMNLSQSRLTRIIDGLVNKGYITRESNRNDWRCLNLTLSRKAKSFIQKLDKNNFELHYKILGKLNISKQNALIAAMDAFYTETENWLRKVL